VNKESPKVVESFATAIARSKPSRPLRKLIESGLLSKGAEVLDYGCGRGHDSRYLNQNGYSCTPYDPHWNPSVSLRSGSYDYITCTFVLNVVKEETERDILLDMGRLLKNGGTAYITVRRDIKVFGKTTRGFQRQVLLGLPKVFDYKNNFCTYIMEKN